MAHILFVEDDELIRTMVATRLGFAGFEVTTATDGIEALLKVKGAHPDLILMDMGLPKLNGWQATQRLRMRRETAHIPIIALSAYVLENDRRQALQIGCNAFVTKPIDFSCLLTTIKELLGEPGA
jgi:two-component system, cell cycle response regulator DivK